MNGQTANRLIRVPEPFALEDELIELGLGREPARFIADRRRQSDDRLAELRRRLNVLPSLQSYPNLLIYAAGSYARGEASEHSDIDLFLMHADLEGEELEDPNLRGIRALASLIRETEEKMFFPTPSNDGQFLKVAKLSSVLEHLGEPEDDYLNHFTARMLLLLESRSVYGFESYEIALSEIVRSYWRDYEDHAEEFRPTFLVNDVLRFWRTLCLNYEHRRNKSSESRKVKQKIRNFKLGFSRLLTCFATVSLLASYNKVDERDVIEIVSLSPMERLLHVARRQPLARPKLVEAIKLYCWFLQKTGLSTEDLESYFSDRSNRVEAFARANEFGQHMFEALYATASAQNTLRYLVV